MASDTELDDLDKKSLKVLADTMKDSVSDKEMHSRIEKAVQSGQRRDLDDASSHFDNMPIEAKQSVGQGAVKVAKKVRAQMPKRVADRLTEDLPENTGMEWGQPDRSSPPLRAAPPPRPQEPAPEPQADMDDEPEENTWDWQAVPEDSVTKSKKAKKGQTDDEFAELRAMMVGPDTGRSW